METKKVGHRRAQSSRKLLPLSKTTMEFIIAISAAAVSFSIINSLGIFDRFYPLISRNHEKLDKLLLAIAFFAAALAVFFLRRLLELQRAHKKLARSEQQLRFQSMLLDEIGDSITATDLEGKIIYVNQTECNWVKRSKDELIGKSVETYGQDPSAGATPQEIIQTTLEKGKWSGEIVNTASDGSKIIVECRTWLMKNKDGNATGMCGIARNITERKERERELVKHKRYLEALDAASGVLLLSISEIKYEDFLAALGTASGADRILVFLKKTGQGGKEIIYNTAQWHRNETTNPVKGYEANNFFMTNIWPRWEKILSEGQPISSLTADFPAPEQSFWKSLNIKALLALPIIIDEKLEGFISFDNCTEERPWTKSEIEFLHAATGDLAITMKRLDIKKELKEQRDFAQRLIETAQTIVLVMDKEANIITFNPYFEKLSGYRLDEVKGKNWFDTFLPSEDRQKNKQVFQKAVNDIHIEGNINPIVSKDGRRRQIEWYARTLKDDQGKVIGILSTGRDITERKRAEEEIRFHSEIMRNIAEGVILTRTSDGTIVYTNPKFEEMFGYGHVELAGKNISVVNAPTAEKSPDEIAKDIQRSLKKTGVWSGEVYNIKKDGTPFWCYANVSTFEHLGYGKVWVAVHTDITERKQAEEELKKAHSELEQGVAQRTTELQKTNAQLLKTMEEKNHIQKILQETEKFAAAGKLAAQIAHEINNPLAGIKNSFLLVKDAIPQSHRYFEYVGRIEKEIGRVSQIVRQMFDLYRPDTAPVNRFRLYDTIRDTVELLKVARQEKHINIEIGCSEKTAVTLSEALLRQVIYNIVQNAIQASGPDATIKILACTDNDRLNLSVSDEGPGIDDKIKDKIFEPFFTTGIGGPEGGLGLGLAITKDIISAMDGTIDFKSEKNKGTVFNISIPIENEPAE